MSLFVVLASLILGMPAFADPSLAVKTPFRVFGCVLDPSYKASVDNLSKNKTAYLKRCRLDRGPYQDCEADYAHEVKLAQQELDDVTGFMVAKDWVKTQYIVDSRGNGKILSPTAWNGHGTDSSFNASLMSGYGRDTPKGTMPYFIGYDFYEPGTIHEAMHMHIFFYSPSKSYPVIDVTQNTGKDTWLQQVFLKCKLDNSATE